MCGFDDMEEAREGGRHHVDQAEASCDVRGGAPRPAAGIRAAMHTDGGPTSRSVSAQRRPAAKGRPTADGWCSLCAQMGAESVTGQRLEPGCGALAIASCPALAIPSQRTRSRSQVALFYPDAKGKPTHLMKRMPALWDNMWFLAGQSEAEAQWLEAHGALLLLLRGIAARDDG
ncbi:hypothetical protein K474DRAFT_719852 [Panus rudis PR-1116 ss-1]|nr:hypothetical protein K474DRAFT_719852 [Panus rudis PR-1116 ss-1]